MHAGFDDEHAGPVLDVVFARAVGIPVAGDIAVHRHACAEHQFERTVAQLDDSLDAVRTLDFSPDELAAIDKAAADGGINLWAESSDIVTLPAAQGLPARKP